MSENPENQNVRRDDRQPVVWTATLIKEDDSEHACSILDVAFAGTLIETDASLDVNEEILLRIDGLGEFAGKVKWSKENNKGLLLMAGPDLLLKEFSTASGSEISTSPKKLTE
ncbi:hypothetical protein QGN29_07065 [Temperatibacter marinus]|uniref:PilZ domain-containing protein n=1 Tax=Temperatibacter marinus TaxID=1456591 RepID=A0AA52HAD3_9PROT|nr:PilZ domain-containing protein [Temperatibacter marinus]WND04131.1 hypothetical protein QGN29_07065 [Temperatibacter marinus]